MSTLTAGKIAEVMFENFIETYEHQTLMLDLVDGEQPDKAVSWLALNVTREQAQRVVDKKVDDLERQLGMK